MHTFVENQRMNEEKYQIMVTVVKLLPTNDSSDVKVYAYDGNEEINQIFHIKDTKKLAITAAIEDLEKLLCQF